MSFLNPFFFIGLLAVAIPVIIHLVNLRRPQKVAFSTLSFIKELRKSTIRRIRIKQYLLMALRMIALLFLALALARPFLPPTLTGSTSSGTPKAVAIMIDNSASMQRVGNRGPLIDQAKGIAERIIQNANSDDKFIIVTTNKSTVGQTGSLDRQDALDAVSEVTANNTGHYTKEQFAKAYRNVQNAPQSQGVAYIISDGQKSQLSDLEEIEQFSKTEKQVSVQLITVAAGKQQNLAISSVEINNQMISHGTPVSISATVENVGSTAAANQFISLSVEGERSGQYEFSLEEGQTKTFEFSITPETAGDLSGQLILEGDQVEYDNRQNFVVRIPSKHSVLLVSGKNSNSSFPSYLSPALEAARETNAQVSFKEESSSEVNPSQWSNYDAIILDGLKNVPEYWFNSLQQYVQAGNGLLFFPSEQGTIENYNQFFSLFNAGQFIDVLGEYGSFNPVTKMAGIEEGHPVLDDIFSKKEDEEINIEESSLFYYFRHQNTTSATGLDVLKADNGDPILTEQRFGKGVVLIASLGTDPGWSNLSVNPIFAPLFYRSTLYASSSERAGLQQHVLGQPFQWTFNTTSSEIQLTLNNSEYKAETQRKTDGLEIRYEGREWEPGMLTIEMQEGNQNIGVNQSIMESRYEPLSEEQWQQYFGNDVIQNKIISANNLSENDFSQELSTAMFGQEIWNWFIWIALLFLLSETIVARLYKAESIS
ncbi:N-terminal double-transmembrane domain-containing protein [Fodinibius salinus]|uniref:N-terminal double-transmembrane domain-containing protein n=1 Tax=Fodinibius salinus TaxID=860790 RepID=A0A5D3YEV7_9BACT|nr:BatA domain-containing protein [Fodinibius salinus]TYP91670.1 N-terminal double-transmembrane domain-containing protein [Fodinibius salinus]